MSAKTTKIAISIPKQTFKEMEHLRHDLGLARSAVVFEAVNLWLHQKESQELEEIYAKGYEKVPEKSSQTSSFFHAGLSSFSKDQW